MLWTLCVVLPILWMLGLITGYRMGGLIHILPMISIVIVLIRVMKGQRMAKDMAAIWAR
jgi:hypothetical protein